MLPLNNQPPSTNDPVNRKVNLSVGVENIGGKPSVSFWLFLDLGNNSILKATYNPTTKAGWLTFNLSF